MSRGDAARILNLGRIRGVLMKIIL